ncbi:MAG: hypothetical protein R3A11_07925 [Bdellovibrionota bacterium]
MNREKKDIEQDLKETAWRLVGLIQEYTQCEGIVKIWIQKILDLNIHALKALLTFLESQKTEPTSKEKPTISSD